MSLFKKLIEIGTKMLDILDDSNIQPIPDYTNFNSVCTSCELGDENEKIYYSTVQDTEPFVLINNDSFFEGIVGYERIKREFVKALNASSPLSILLCGPPGCGKSEFLKQIQNHFQDVSVLIDGSYGSKAGIFEKLYKNRPKYVLLDEIDKLSGLDQLALLNLMESGKLTKTTRSESYEIKLTAWVFASANNKDDILHPPYDRFETYFLGEYTNAQFREVTARRLKQEGVNDDELALYITNAVLRSLNRKSLRDAIRIARKCKTFEDVDETVQSLKKYGDLK